MWPTYSAACQQTFSKFEFVKSIELRGLRRDMKMKEKECSRAVTSTLPSVGAISSIVTEKEALSATNTIRIHIFDSEYYSSSETRGS